MKIEIYVNKNLKNDYVETRLKRNLYETDVLLKEDDVEVLIV